MLNFSTQVIIDLIIKGEHYGVTNQLILYEDIESKVSNHYDIYEISYDDSNDEIKNDLLEIGDLYQTKNREFAIKLIVLSINVNYLIIFLKKNL